MLKDIYKLSKEFKREKLKIELSMVFRNSNIQEKEGRFVVSTNEGEIIKIAYNENGLYKNYIEMMKIFKLLSLNDKVMDKKFLNFLESIETFISEKDEFISYENLIEQRIVKWDDLLIKDKVQILKYYKPDESLFYTSGDIYHESSLYYKLKKLITTFEKKGFLGNISINDLITYDNVSHFINLENIYPYKNNIFFTCPKCNGGILRFDIEHFLRKGEDTDWEAKYNCSNSLCNNNYTFSEIDKTKEFEEKCMLDIDYLNSYKKEPEINHYSEDNSYEEDNSDFLKNFKEIKYNLI